jgi:hypothetical protein
LLKDSTGDFAMTIFFHSRQFCLALILFLPFMANAESGQAIPKDGVCPIGYHTEGNYCVASRVNAPDAVAKDGVCPIGYSTQGNYCVANRANPPDAILKNGVCPTGYHTEGNYCVGNRR